jgi:hypothetical protein
MERVSNQLTVYADKNSTDNLEQVSNQLNMEQVKYSTDSLERKVIN